MKFRLNHRVRERSSYNTGRFHSELQLVSTRNKPLDCRILKGAGLDLLQPTREVARNVIGPTSPGGLPDWTLMLSWKVGHNRQP
jgi:hypothetical protein